MHDVNINGKSIFLPLSGYYYNNKLNAVGQSGFFWSSSLYVNEELAYHLDCKYDDVIIDAYNRCVGFSIRPVSTDKKYIVSFDANGGEGIMEDIEFETKRNYEEKFEKINYGDLNDFSLVYEKKINFSDLDHYGHMNNAKYLVILMDSLNLNKDDLIEEIQVDYINQGYKGHILKVYLKKENNINYLVGKDSDNIIFVIKAKIKE